MRSFSRLEETEDAEAKAAFHLRMRARGIQDRDVLRAFELVPRDVFVPERYRALVARDLPIPIGCGQTQLEPWLTARIIMALAVERHHRVLEIGSGTGYATAVLATLAGDVIGIERFQGLAAAAQARLDTLAMGNAVIVWGDGLAIPAIVEPFDRIIVHGLLATLPPTLVDRLQPGGLMVCARPGDAATQQIARIEKDTGGAVSETTVCPCRLQAMVPGAAAFL